MWIAAAWFGLSGPVAQSVARSPPVATRKSSSSAATAGRPVARPRHAASRIALVTVKFPLRRNCPDASTPCGACAIGVASGAGGALIFPCDVATGTRKNIAERMHVQEDLASRIGLVEEREGALEPALAGMLGAALGHAAAPLPDNRAGAPMPPLWHWAAFPEFVPPGELGADGHPRLGRFLPDTGLPRRMWAGGRVAFEGALRVGEPLGQRARIASIDEKTGAAGRMV